MLKLVRLEPKYRPLLNEMMDEWTASGEEIIPWSIRKCDYRSFDRYLAGLEVREPSGALVPDSTFFCLDTDRNRFIGAVNIRHRLNAASQRRTYRGRNPSQRTRERVRHEDDRSRARGMQPAGH